jgi:hypothetical protein
MAGMGLLLATVFGSNVGVAMFALSLGTAGVLATMPVFWTWPSAMLGGSAAAAGIGLIIDFSINHDVTTRLPESSTRQ